MIEEIKKEIITIKEQMLKEYKIDLTNDKIREFYYIQCLDMVLRIIEEHNTQQSLVTLKDFENVSNKLIDYQNAFEYMYKWFNQKNNKIDTEESLKIEKIVIDFMNEMIKKYNLGGE